VAATGLAAQLVHPAHVALPDNDVAGPHHRHVEQVGEVPAIVTADELGGGRYEHGELALPVGLDFTTGRAHHLTVPDGDHVLVLGGSRTGRSTTLTRLTVAWRTARPAGRVVALLPRRSAFDIALADTVRRADEPLSADDLRGDADAPLLVVCDDADLLDDADGVLSALAARRTDGVTVVAAARPDGLRSRYGHWTTGVRHARLGLVAAGGGDTDADLLSAVVPRRLPVRARPGLMWVIDHGGQRLVQVALDLTTPLSAGSARH
jgi:S-DNA-T family DNA segregation ATPase FtsK/SpoIIIE